MDVQTWQWILIIGMSLLLFLIAPLSKTKDEFFKATKSDKKPGFWLLTSSLVISWVFAKSITNAANLGLSFGFVGGVAYALYYLSFLVAGWIIYQMRVKGGFLSIHHFLQKRFGREAVMLFSLLIGFRLFNEVWSNTMVIGSYFGHAGSISYFTAILVFTGLTLAYSIKGGLQSSLLTDLIQMVLFGLLLFIILGVLIPKEGGDIGKFVASGEWTLAGGLNLAFVALIQVFSYPFHDPVLTDRGFIGTPKTTLKSFFWATWIGGVCILLFSFVGIYAQFQGMEGQAAVGVSQAFGVAMMLMMNFIMVTSAASTLDSAFASFSKLAVVDLGKKENISISKGRWAMVILTVLGTIPIFFNAEILSATTISGTMVIGLAPIFLFWNKEVPKITFVLVVVTGMLFGGCLAMGCWPAQLTLFDGKYGDLFSANLLGTITCFAVYGLMTLVKKDALTTNSKFLIKNK
ncbi:MAG: Na+/proline symporter [Paraglaciecola sp.]